MAKKIDLERVGGGRYDIYRPKPKKKTDWGEILGGIVVAVLALIVLANVL